MEALCQLSYGPKTVSPAGVEPATFALGVQRSIQLSYGDLCQKNNSNFSNYYQELIKQYDTKNKQSPLF